MQQHEAKQRKKSRTSNHHQDDACKDGRKKIYKTAQKTNCIFSPKHKIFLNSFFVVHIIPLVVSLEPIETQNGFTFFIILILPRELRMLNVEL